MNTATLAIEPMMGFPSAGPRLPKSDFFRNLSPVSIPISGQLSRNPKAASWRRFEDSRGMLSPRIAMPFILAGLFALSFLFPVLVAAHLNGMFDDHWDSSNVSRQEIFPHSVSLGQNDGPIKVGPGTGLDPVPGRDFLLVSWFKFRKVPISGDKSILLTKFPDERKPKSGYALGLIDDHGVLRPMVYWGTADGGRWYRFSEFEVPARTWTMFAVSLREGRYLGLHAATVTEPGRADIQLLGGYDLGTETLSAPEIPLTVSPAAPTRYVGRVGPVGVFNVKGLTNSLKEVVKDLARSPLEIPSAFSSSNVGLWFADGKTDESPNHHEITISSGKSAR